MSIKPTGRDRSISMELSLILLFMQSFSLLFLLCSLETPYEV